MSSSTSQLYYLAAYLLREIPQAASSCGGGLPKTRTSVGLLLNCASRVPAPTTRINISGVLSCDDIRATLAEFKDADANFSEHGSCSRMLCGRVPAFRLGSRSPGGDQKSLRLCPQAFASVRKGFASARECRAFLGVENCRETRNCRNFETRVGSSRLKSANSRRDGGGRGREVQKCRHFGTCGGSSRFKSVNSHRDRGGRGREVQKLNVVTSGLVFCLEREWERAERGESRGERREEREERREEGGGRREERRETGDEREERRQEKSGERRGERREKREERGGEWREERGERKEKREEEERRR